MWKSLQKGSHIVQVDCVDVIYRRRHPAHVYLDSVWIFICDDPKRRNAYVIDVRLKQRPVTRSLNALFDLHMNKRLGKQSRRQWIETQSRSLWRQDDGELHSF